MMCWLGEVHKAFVPRVRLPTVFPEVQRSKARTGAPGFSRGVPQACIDPAPEGSFQSHRQAV